MNENQINPEPGYQQNQPLQDNLTDNQTQSGTYQKEDSENSDSNSRQEFPERTQQHDYTYPTANQNDEEDEVDTETENFDQEEETDNDPADEQTDVSNLGLV